VVLPNGKTYEEVTVVGRDPLNDIAFLKINDVTDLIAAKLGDSSTMEVGQKVVAIGNALGQFQTTVTSGIISGTSRPVTASDGTSTGVEQLENLFQTDAAINPGNSGGPLVNLNGEVIGINTAVAEGAQGIGFAIPINDAKGLIKGVVATGQIQRAYLGVRYVTISPETAKQLNLTQQKGAYIGGSDASPIISGSPAEKAGIQAEDIITKVNGVELNDRVTLIGQLSQFVPGDEVTLTILRDKKEQAIKVTLEKLES
ncbi:trypsin-like peptidase domain-containing protein, partial [Pedobacter sp.]|nr:trypsin-like peptidase domain-containing protein [Candidatus Saccharibacteria bacterium]